MDITIKNVPKECEEEVKKMALVAVRRFYEKSLKPSEQVIIEYENNINTFCTDNSIEE